MQQGLGAADTYADALGSRAATRLDYTHERVVGGRRPLCPWTAEVPICDLLLPPRSSASCTTFASGKCLHASLAWTSRTLCGSDLKLVSA
jgi:hypothetical protein